jgi:Amt family ammonium transporter
MSPSSIDLLWVILAAALVFLMQAGFLCLETGFTRSKNSINVAVKNLADFGLSVLLFWAVGFGLMFGATQTGWVGTSRFLPNLSGGSAWDAAFFLYQVVFCGTAVTIVSGAVAERVRFGGYLFIALIVGVTYPLFGHWVWGGALADQTPWLAGLGFVDFAGSSVVHSVGGWFSLVACLIIGPRLGRFGKQGEPHDTPGSNLPMAMLGTLLLWFGWIGFNGGSTLALDATVPGIILNTMLAAGAGMLIAGAMGWFERGHPQPSPLINGTLAGLVAITANCHSVTSADALLIGAVGGGLAHLTCRLLLRLKIDDVISAVPVHLVAGIWGTLAVALFGDLDILGTGLSRWQQFQVQAWGVVACGGLCLTVAIPTLWAAHRLIGLRVSEEDEKLGLNVAEHRASTELYDFATTLQRQAETKDLSLRAPVEAFTEVGQIAERYNELMGVIQRSTTDIAELKATEKLLREAHRNAEAANQAKTEFLANMSHEIRTPLHGILSFSRFGTKRAEADGNEKLHGYFEKIGTSGDRLLLLVNDLLDLAKLESGKIEFDFTTCDLGNVVACVVDEFASLVSEQQLSVAFEKPPGDTSVEADRGKIMQVLRNVINNAIKFSPKGSAIQVSLTPAPHGGPRIEISDQGMGIPADELDAVFDKFVQSTKTRTQAGGTGLGLSICREIMTGHHGSITASNVEGGGARFVIEWPRVQPQASPEGSAARAA